ncbi:MAG: hypothetical protein A2521_08330 [Deltaproteobacteria bacterium RIFOXYD12_FULL_57_12]|nr:MAG: hypothetical protein A2521_08330 [Deltaproteobacteria bacterium RIFOXYD12_FULL_57_12]
MKKLLHSLPPLLGLLLFGVALWSIHHTLQAYPFHDILRHLRELPANHLVAALGLTVLGYLVLTGYDRLALHYVDEPLPYARIATASFISYAFSHNIGLAMVSGATVRIRLYSAFGLSTIKIAQVIAFTSLTLWIGFLFLCGTVFLLEPMRIPDLLHFPLASVQPLGVVFLLLVAGYLLRTSFGRRRITVHGWELRFPSLRLALAQIGISSLDWTLSGSVLYLLLPTATAPSFPAFLSVYLLAQFAGIVSQVPGGLGVFETVILLFFSPLMPAAEVAAALLAFRAIYYFLPLLAAAMLLGSYEILQRKEELKLLTDRVGRWLPALTPPVLAFTTFLGGTILLFSGATPAISSRLHWIKNFLPLPVLELSHFMGSLVGVGLLFLARGVQRRLDAAYLLTLVLLWVGAMVSLLKGADYEEAVILLIMLATLLPCRRYFYRKTLLIDQRFSAAWLVAIAVVLASSTWLGYFSFKHIEYSNELWWRFSFTGGGAPRFLRATVGVFSLTLLFSFSRLLRSASSKPTPPTTEELNRCRAIIALSPESNSNLALLGDKMFLFSDSGLAFIMYGIAGRSWVAMGDPVGPSDEWPELLWRFREMVDQHGGWPVFYEIRSQHLHLYLDLGLTLLKFGEQARVRLDSFSLTGSDRKTLRNGVNRLEKQGCEFELAPVEAVATLLPELKNISDGWLAEKNSREKGFSLGFFDPDYLLQFPVGLVRQAGKIVAFANIWPSGSVKEELSIDLMRYLPAAPNGVMEYLLVQLMLWGRQEGYCWFNLGMAPLSGLENRALAPLWNRFGSLIYHHAELVYNFQGLREYKEKFGPEWEPMYMASPGGLVLPRILTNVAALISGGLQGVVRK